VCRWKHAKSGLYTDIINSSHHNHISHHILAPAPASLATSSRGIYISTDHQPMIHRRHFRHKHHCTTGPKTQKGAHPDPPWPAGVFPSVLAAHFVARLCVLLCATQPSALGDTWNADTFSVGEKAIDCGGVGATESRPSSNIFWCLRRSENRRC
jgi:hypothetical protein